MLPLTKIPLADAPPMPPKKLRGILMTNAQGQLITKKVNALVIQSLHIGALPMMSRTTGGSTARATAL